MDNIILVGGNCDNDFDKSKINHKINDPYLFLEVSNLKIMAAHGYNKPIDKILEDAKSIEADIFIYGHTHVKYLKKRENIIILNPGSTSLPRDNIHSVAIIENRSINLIDIENNGEVIETLRF